MSGDVSRFVFLIIFRVNLLLCSPLSKTAMVNVNMFYLQEDWSQRLTASIDRAHKSQTGQVVQQSP